MRVVLDTNVVVSALLFGGTPRSLLRVLCKPPFELWSSRPLLRKLAATLEHEKLGPALARTGVSADNLVQAYASQTFIVSDASLPRVRFAPDPGDAPVLATALAAGAHWLVTGDGHVLTPTARLTVTPRPVCEVLDVAQALERAAALLGNEEQP